MIIGFAGTKGSGKSTACAVLEKRGYEVINFADPLKMMAVELTGVGLHECYDLEAKERKRDFIITSEEFINLLQGNGISSIPGYLKAKPYHEFSSLRQVLQHIGTELFREADKDFWIKALVSKIHPSKNYAIGDMRYQNEVETVKRLGGTSILIVRPGFELPKDTHASEQVNVTVDHTIINEDINQFEKDVLAIAGLDITNGKIL